jgi:CelD/BcsL family acetyltransferase involved in cellulose biosynthesis
VSTEVLVYQHPDEFPEDVAQLFSQGEGINVSFGSVWFRTLIASALQPDEAVRFYVLRRDRRAVAALPVLVKQRASALHHAVAALSNYYTPLYAPLIAAPMDSAELATLIRAVRRAESPMATLRLQPMDPQSSSYPVLLAALRHAGLVSFEFYCFGNWFLPVPQDWASFLVGRSSKMRSNIKRMEKKLAQGGGSIEIIVLPSECERGIEAYQRVYDASWKQQEPHPLFMATLITQASKNGWLRLGIAWLDGKPIAAQVWIVANGKADIYKVAYDEAFKEYSPGTVLTARLMQHVIECDHVHEVDYLIGDDPYKKTWMSDRRERWGVVAYNPATLAGALGAAREALGRYLKRMLKRLKALDTKPSTSRRSATPPDRVPLSPGGEGGCSIARKANST